MKLFESMLESLQQTSNKFWVVDKVPLTEEEFESFFKKRIEKCKATLLKKSEEYSAENDKMRNFNVVARMMNMTPQQVAFMFMMKHFESVYEIVMNEKEVTLEMWDEKMGDLMNYFFLIDAMMQKELEDEQA